MERPRPLTIIPVIPGFAQCPVNDRMFYGPYKAAASLVLPVDFRDFMTTFTDYGVRSIRRDFSKSHCFQRFVPYQYQSTKIQLFAFGGQEQINQYGSIVANLSGRACLRRF
jgi:hypothetical protein